MMTTILIRETPLLVLLLLLLISTHHSHGAASNNASNNAAAAPNDDNANICEQSNNSCEDNDRCTQALDIWAGETLTGNTTNSVWNLESNYCYGNCQDNCGSALGLYTRGVWFYTDETDAVLEVSTCGSSFDTQISVFEGNNCRRLECVDGNDDNAAFCGPLDPAGPLNGRGSMVRWTSIDGSGPYYILVHGAYNSHVPYEGEYQITLNKYPINDDCENATDVDIDIPIPVFTPPGQEPAQVSVDGSTFWGHNDLSFDMCPGASQRPEAPGVWYRFIGTGRSVTITLCNDRTNYDTQIAVYTGNDCGSLTCVAGNDDFDTTNCGLTSTVSIDAADGTTYYVLVYGYYATAYLYVKGDFTVSFIPA